MTHREAIKEWLGQIELKDQLVIDWGSGSKPVSRYIIQHGCAFITIDKNPLIAPDRRSNLHFEHDIQQPFDVTDKYRPADVAFCIEVLEHTLRPDLVLKNIYDNLKEGGKFYLSIPFLFPIHSDDDFIRLTENGLKAWYEIIGFKIEEIRASTGEQGYLIKAYK